MENNRLTPVHSHIKTTFSMGGEKYHLETRYFALTIELTDSKKRDTTFYIKILNKWINAIQNSGVRLQNGEMFLSVDNIELLAFSASDIPFILRRKYRIRLEMRRDNDFENYEKLLSTWKTNLNNIVVSKRGAIIKLKAIEDV